MNRLTRRTVIALAATLWVATGAFADAGNAASHHTRAKLQRGALTIQGTDAGEQIALRLQQGDPAILQVDVGDDGTADFSFERADISSIAVLAGAGDDSFVWDPGDGSDTIEGGDGADTMVFNGANGAEKVELSANGSRLEFTRDLGGITMDTAGVENVDFNALGGADQVTVDDLTGTDVTAVDVDLAGTLRGSAGDGQPDRVIVNATAGDDSIFVNGGAGKGGVSESGLAAGVNVLHSEAANDRLEINTLAGTDSVDSSGLAAGALQLVVDGALVP